MRQETWMQVVGYEGLYEISDLGRLRSIDRVIQYVRKNGNICNARYSGKLLKGTPDLDGRLCATLSHGTSKSQETMRIATLVATAFLGQRPQGKEVCHRDDDKTSNGVTNLYWGTRDDNFNDAHRNKVFPVGEKSATAKLTEKDVLYIRGVAGSMSQKELAKRYGVRQQTIQAVVHRRTWRHVNAAT